VYINAADESARETLMEGHAQTGIHPGRHEAASSSVFTPTTVKSTKPPDKDQMEAKVYGNIPVEIGDMNSPATAGVDEGSKTRRRYHLQPCLSHSRRSVGQRGDLQAGRCPRDHTSRLGVGVLGLRPRTGAPP
jgi:hypothetical protein